MRKYWLILLAVVVVGIFCFVLLWYWRFMSEFMTFLQSLKTAALLSVPVFFIIGVYIFEKYKWSITSILSLWCLIFLAIGSWLAVVTMLSSTSPDSDGDATIEAYLMWIYSAEIGLIIVMITSAIANYRINKRISESTSSDEEFEDDETEYPPNL